MKGDTIISEIIYNAETVQPVLGKFQNGIIEMPNETSLAVDVLEDVEKKRLAAIAVGKHLYTGDVKCSDDYNNFIAVKKRNSNKMILLAVDSCLFSAVIPELTNQTDVVSAAVAKGQLNKQFGSKKAKRITEQYERMKMNTDNVAQVLEATAIGIKVDKADLVQPEVTSNDSTYIPTINRDATTIQEIYDIKNLLPLDEFTVISEDISSVLVTEEKIIRENVCPLIAEEIIKLINGERPKDDLPALIYIDCLIKLLNTSSKHISQRKFNPSPNFVRLGNYILKNFTLFVNNTRTRPVSMRDKTVCHILVLLILVFNYNMNIESISKLLKIGAKKLLEFGRMLSFTTTNYNKDFQLKLPLPTAYIPYKSKRNKK